MKFFSLATRTLVLLALVPSVALADWTRADSAREAAYLALHEDANKSQHAVVKTLDADGFTLTWTNAASPAEAVITIAYAAVG